MFDIIIPTNGGSLPSKLIESIITHTEKDRLSTFTVGPNKTNTFQGLVSWIECHGSNARRINVAVEQTHSEHTVILHSLCELLPQGPSQWVDQLLMAVSGENIASAGPLKLHHSGVDYIDLFCAIIPRKVWKNVGPLREDLPFSESVLDWFSRSKHMGLSVNSVSDVSNNGTIRVGSFPIYYPGGDEPEPNFYEGTRILYTKHRKSGRNQSVPVTAHISTKNRHATTLPLAIHAISMQNVVPAQLLIFDDDLGVVSFYEETKYAHLFDVLSTKGCEIQVVSGSGTGQVANHQMAIEMAKMDFIWRVDDDNSAEPNVLQHLYHIIHSDPQIGAVASLVHFPWCLSEPLDIRASGRISDIKSKQNVQWYSFQGQKEVQHLHNTFLFRKSAACHGYPKNLSMVGHREETIFTASMALDGWKLFVTGDVITWHLRAPEGGIRSFQDSSLWAHDEEIFLQWAKERKIQFNEYWIIVLDNGLGDHWAFKHVLPKIINKAKSTGKILLLAVCYPSVFEDLTELNMISIHDAKKLTGDTFHKHNIYNYMIEKNWTGNLVDAFHSMHGV